MLLLSGITVAQSAKRGRILFLACILIGFVFLILTKSRTSFASAMLALFVYFALVSSIKRKLALILAVSLTFCLLLLLAGDALFPALWQGILLGREDATTYTLTGRIPVWKECLSYIAERPFLGHGYNAFWTPEHVRDISDRAHWDYAGVPWALNGYIDLVLSVGLVGASAYILVLALAIKRSIALYKRSNSTGYGFAYAMFVFFLLVMFLEGIAFDAGIATFIVLTLLAKLGFCVSRTEERQLFLTVPETPRSLSFTGSLAQKNTELQRKMPES